MYSLNSIPTQLYSVCVIIVKFWYRRRESWNSRSVLSFHGCSVPLSTDVECLAYPHSGNRCLVETSKSRTPWTPVIDTCQVPGSNRRSYGDDCSRFPKLTSYFGFILSKKRKPQIKRSKSPFPQRKYGSLLWNRDVLRVIPKGFFVPVHVLLTLQGALFFLLRSFYGPKILRYW